MILDVISNRELQFGKVILNKKVKSIHYSLLVTSLLVVAFSQAVSILTCVV